MPFTDSDGAVWLFPSEPGFHVGQAVHWAMDGTDPRFVDPSVPRLPDGGIHPRAIHPSNNPVYVRFVTELREYEQRLLKGMQLAPGVAVHEQIEAATLIPQYQYEPGTIGAAIQAELATPLARVELPPVRPPIRSEIPYSASQAETSYQAPTPPTTLTPLPRGRGEETAKDYRQALVAAAAEPGGRSAAAMQEEEVKMPLFSGALTRRTGYRQGGMRPSFDLGGGVDGFSWGGLAEQAIGGVLAGLLPRLPGGAGRIVLPGAGAAVGAVTGAVKGLAKYKRVAGMFATLVAAGVTSELAMKLIEPEIHKRPKRGISAAELRGFRRVSRLVKKFSGPARRMTGKKKVCK